MILPTGLVCAACGKDIPVKYIQSEIDESRKFCDIKCVRLYYNREKKNEGPVSEV